MARTLHDASEAASQPEEEEDKPEEPEADWTLSASGALSEISDDDDDDKQDEVPAENELLLLCQLPDLDVVLLQQRKVLNAVHTLQDGGGASQPTTYRLLVRGRCP